MILRLTPHPLLTILYTHHVSLFTVWTAGSWIPVFLRRSFQRFPAEGEKKSQTLFLCGNVGTSKEPWEGTANSGPHHWVQISSDWVNSKLWPSLESYVSEWGPQYASNNVPAFFHSLYSYFTSQVKSFIEPQNHNSQMCFKGIWTAQDIIYYTDTKCRMCYHHFSCDTPQWRPSVQNCALLSPFVRFTASRLQTHAKYEEPLERDEGGSVMQPGGGCDGRLYVPSQSLAIWKRYQRFCLYMWLNGTLYNLVCFNQTGPLKLL